MCYSWEKFQLKHLTWLGRGKRIFHSEVVVTLALSEPEVADEAALINNHELFEAKLKSFITYINVFI